MDTQTFYISIIQTRTSLKKKCVNKKHLIVTPLVVLLILRHAGVLVDKLLDKLRRHVPLVLQPGDFLFQTFLVPVPYDIFRLKYLTAFIPVFIVSR